MLIMPVTMAERGIAPVEIKIKAVARVNVLQGQVVQFDLSCISAATLNNDRDGGTDSGLVNVTTITAQSTQVGPLGIVNVATASGLECDVTIYGYCQALVSDTATSGTIVAGDRLTVASGTSSTSLSGIAPTTGSANARVVWARSAINDGITITMDGSATPVLMRVWFNGLAPMGIYST